MALNRIACIIPARFNSSRLPGKPLIKIKGLPLVMWAYNQALAAKVFDEVIVATDDYRIKDTVEECGGSAVITYGAHDSGTDRVNEAAKSLNCSHIVNLQGDEPLISTELLKQICQSTFNCDDNTIITAVSQTSGEDVDEPSNVKVVLDKNNNALYFSRQAIPYSTNNDIKFMYKHIGIYGFSVESLNRFCCYSTGYLENIEKIELLRALENNIKVNCIITKEDSIGIDTEKDLQMLKKQIYSPKEYIAHSNTLSQL